MAYNRPPAWRYSPPTDPPPQPLQQVADAMVKLGGWFKDTFWTSAGTDCRINTKLITKQLEGYLPSDPAGVRLEDGLLCGWNVETRDPLLRIPLLYGENGKPLYGVNPDAIYASDDGYGIDVLPCRCGLPGARGWRRLCGLPSGASHRGALAGWSDRAGGGTCEPAEAIGNRSRMLAPGNWQARTRSGSRVVTDGDSRSRAAAAPGCP
jgi:hypothetical protein